MNRMEAPFDRRAKRLHRTRAAASMGQHDFLLRLAAEEIGARLQERGQRFARAAALGGGAPLLDALRPHCAALVHADLSGAMGPDVVADEEFNPFAREAFDLVASGLVLHWVNDLPGALIQIARTLRPEGLFLGAMLGGETLRELRTAFVDGESETRGGASPHVSPFVDVRDAGMLLQRAGFRDPVADIDTFTVTYADPLKLMHELRGMGEANALHGRSKTMLPRATLQATAAAYRARFGSADGRVPATFQIVTLTARAPDPAAALAAERRRAGAPPLRLRPETPT